MPTKPQVVTSISKNFLFLSNILASKSNHKQQNTISNLVS